MKLTDLQPNAKERSALSQILRVMRFTILLLLVGSMHVYADGFSQSKISLRLEKADLKRALMLIEKQSNVRFLYSQSVLKNVGKVSVDANNEALVKVLNELLDGTGISYKLLEDDLVVLNFDEEFFAPADVTVTGNVLDSAGNPVSGASVSVKGTKNGTATDVNGKYTITVADNATLIFSGVGFNTVEEKVNGRTTISPTLVVSERKLDEVVVIGYGTASKRDLTGSIVKVSGKEVADKPNSNPISSLQGKVAGLSVVNSGTPGQAPDVRIRGTVSIGNVHPLYVVDGIFNDNIDYINPNDIESIEILKDPSSLAIFGVKGATGVIAITTKRAKAGQVVINFATNFGYKKLVDKIKLANADEFKTLFAEERANSGTTAPFDYTGLTANTDWIDAVTRTGKFSNNTLSVSGSTEKNRFNFNLGYIYDEGIIRHQQLDKWLFSINDEFKISKAIRMGVNVNVSRQNNPYDVIGATAGHLDVLDAARKVIPQVSAETMPFLVRNPYGTDTVATNLYSGLDVGLQSSGVVNPLVQLENEWDKVRSYELRTVGSVFGEVTFLKNFTFRGTVYADVSNVETRQYTPLYYNYNPKDNTPVLVSQSTKVLEDNNTWRKFQQDYVLNYKKSFGDHNLTATAGFTTYYFGNFNRQGTASQVAPPTGTPIPNDPRFWYINSGFQDPSNTSAGSSQSEYTTVSFLGRILYNYQSKYFLNASFRNDASSRLPPDNRNQQFWAVGAAWEVTKEGFMQNQSLFDFLKLKASIGVLGNQTASTLDGTPLNYPYYPNLLTGTNAVFGTNVIPAARPAYIPNPNLKWETVHAKEIGVELNAFKNRLHFEGNYFDRTTEDLMTYVSRGTIGLPDELINGGSIKNTGEELTASWTENLSRDFTLGISGNITFLQNKVLSLSEELPTGVLIRSFQNNGAAESRTTPGQPIGVFFGYVVDGIYQSNEEIAKSPDASKVTGGTGSNGKPVPGDFKFRDVNGDGMVTPDDRTVIGNPTPDFSYGASINVGYKGLSLSVDMVGVYGNEIFRTWGSLESPFQRVNYSAEKLDRWHGPGTSNWVPIINQGDRYNYNGSTYNIEDGSYFRFRNIQLGYAFSQSMLSKIKVKNLRVFVNVQNLKTYKNNLGYTAEYGGDATAFGYDNATGAIPMTSTIGLNVTF
jgi:TonB-linked SusC/RagA family outer membrane protein